MKRYYYRNAYGFSNTGAAVKVDANTNAEKALIENGWERITRREAEQIEHKRAENIETAYINIYGFVVHR